MSDADRVAPGDCSPEAPTELNEKIQALHAYGFKYQRAVMVGGPSKSPIWPTLVADIAGI